MAARSLSARERRVFVDSSAYPDLLDKDDEHHEEAIGILNSLAVQRNRQFTTSVLLSALERWIALSPIRI